MKRSIGVADEMWVYAVSDGERAASLHVVIAPLPAVLAPWAAVLGRHYAGDDGGCDLLAAGTCSLSTSALQGRKFWAAHGNAAQPEQSEAFWLALEAEVTPSEPAPDRRPG
jgi:hypothetical protein